MSGGTFRVMTMALTLPVAQRRRRSLRSIVSMGTKKVYRLVDELSWFS